MPQLIHEIGRVPEKFGLNRCRLERKGFLRVYSFGFADRAGRHELMHRGDAVAVMPVDFARRELYMIEQPRFLRAFAESAEGRAAISSADGETSFEVPNEDIMTLEMPAGVIDEGETPRRAALRELREETGVVVPDSALEQVATYYPSVGGSTELLTAFIARLDGAAEFTEPAGDGFEIIRVWKLGWDEAFDLMRAGKKIRTASSNLLLRELMIRDLKR